MNFVIQVSGYLGGIYQKLLEFHAKTLAMRPSVTERARLGSGVNSADKTIRQVKLF